MNGEEPQFVEELLSTDKATFTRDYVVNSHNIHIWSDENSHAVQERNFKERFFINVWAGVVGNELIGTPRLIIIQAYLVF